jgi:hypothetical protein
MREPDTYRRLVWLSFEKCLPSTPVGELSRTADWPHPMEIHVLPDPLPAAEPDCDLTVYRYPISKGTKPSAVTLVGLSFRSTH